MEKKVLLVEAVFVVGVFLYLFFATAPSAVSPIAGQVVSDPNFIFEIANGEEILISSAVDFSNPIILREGEDVTLPPGKYYWKVHGTFRDSDVQEFVIESNVGLNLHKGEDKNLIENSGNVETDIKKSGGITSGSLDVGESEFVEKEDETYYGSQK